MNTTSYQEHCDRLLRLPQVEEVVGLKRSKLYDMIKRGEFPAPVKPTPGTSAWRASSIQQWIESCPTAV